MMHGWFTKNLGDAMLAGEALAQLKELFLSVYGNSDDPGKAAIFIRHESEGRLHCEVKAYFTPDAFIVAEMVGAAPCARPSQDDLGLLIDCADC